MRWVNYTKATGTTTSVANMKLIDANANFLGGGLPVVFPGDVVEREDATGGVARVVQVLSATELLLSAHIFTQPGVRYRIRAGYVELRGVAGQGQAGELVDQGQNFRSAGVRAGFTVYARGEVFVVTGVEEHKLLLSRPVDLSGERYVVYPGEWVYAEALDWAKASTWRLMAADSTEVSRESPGVLKGFPFFAIPGVFFPRRMVVAAEAWGQGALSLRVDGQAVAQAQVPSSRGMLILSAELDLTAGKHTVDLYALPQNGPISLALVEFFSCEVIE